MLIVTNRESEQFTGIGYYQVIDQASDIMFGPLTSPTSGFYDVVIRYDLEGILTWSTVLLTVTAGPEDGEGPTMCDSTTDINGTLRVDYTSWTMGSGLAISRQVCLRGGKSYTFQLNNFDSGQMNSKAMLHLDSLVLIFVNASTLQELLGAETLVDYGQCASYFRLLSTIDSADPSCEQDHILGVYCPILWCTR